MSTVRPMYLRPCWIKPDGEVILCLNWDHVFQAGIAFPEATGDVELVAVRAGWFKIFGDGEDMDLLGTGLTSAQRRVIEGWGHDADSFEEKAKRAFSFAVACEAKVRQALASGGINLRKKAESQ